MCTVSTQGNYLSRVSIQLTRRIIKANLLNSVKLMLWVPSRLCPSNDPTIHKRLDIMMEKGEQCMCSCSFAYWLMELTAKLYQNDCWSLQREGVSSPTCICPWESGNHFCTDLHSPTPEQKARLDLYHGTKWPLKSICRLTCKEWALMLLDMGLSLSWLAQQSTMMSSWANTSTAGTYSCYQLTYCESELAPHSKSTPAPHTHLVLIPMTHNTSCHRSLHSYCYW